MLVIEQYGESFADSLLHMSSFDDELLRKISDHK